MNVNEGVKMSNTFRFFKCNIINGCRLADIERFVSRDEVFYLNSHIACTSRSVNAAVNSKWIIEISEKEASKHISIPKFVEVTMQKKNTDIDTKTTINHETKTNNAAYERYQARLQKLATSKKNEDDVIVDEVVDMEAGKDFNKNSAAEIRIKNRSRKIKNIKDQENDFINEFVEVEKEGSKNKIDITRQINENKTVSKAEQFIKKSKVDIKNELEAKLSEKISQKKTIETVTDVIETDDVKVDEIEVKPKRKYNKKIKNIEIKVSKKSKKPPVVETSDIVMVESKEDQKIENIAINVEKPKRGRPKKIKV